MLRTFMDSIQRDKRSAIVIGAVAILLILIFVFTKLFSGSNGAVAKAFEELAEAETYHVKANLDLDLPVQLRTRERPIVGITARVEGDVDARGDQPQLAGTVYTEARGRGMILFADGDIRILPDHVTFNLENLPALLNPKGTLIEKWTRVNTALASTRNQDDIAATLPGALQSLSYAGKEDLPEAEGVTAKKYEGALTAEEEDALIEVLRQGKSGNKAFHVVVRLLRSFDVRNLSVWTVKGKVRRIEAQFVAQESDVEPRGILTVDLSEYGKQVAIEDPTPELTVKPDIFARIFGSGELEEF